MKKIIAFDLEGTLTEGGLWKGINNALIKHMHLWRYLLYQIPNKPRDFLTSRNIGDREGFKVHLINSMVRMFKGFLLDQLNEISDSVVEDELWAKRRGDVVAILEEYTRNQEYQVVIISGTYQIILRAFANKISPNIDVIGTQIGILSGQVLGKIYGEANLGENKLKTLSQYLGQRDLESVFGDTHSDVFIMQNSKKPVAVYPNNALRKIAIERGWKIIDKNG